MKKNKLIPFSLLFIALVFLELFCIVKYSDVYYFPLCVGLTLIGSAYLLLTEIDNVVTTFLKNKEKASMPDEDTIARREEASKIAKATYVLEKRILNLLDERILSPEENMENLSTLEGEIVHAIKASIKYGRDNTNHLSEVIAEASTAADYEDILAKLDELILVLKNNQIVPSTVQSPVQQVNYEEVPVEPIMTEAETAVEEPIIEAVDMPEFVDTLTAETTSEEPGATEIEPEFASELEPEPVSGANAVPEPSTAPIDSDPNKPMSPEDIAALIAAAEAQSEPEIEAAPEPAPTAPIDSDPNKPMSPDEIAALIAAEAGSATESEVEADPVVEAEAVSAPTPVDSDPNKPMSPDEIAALIAAAEAESAPEPEPAPAPVAKAPVDSDPNKPMSPEDIAALIAATEAQSEPEIEAAPEPALTAPVDSDPNKPMSPDEIAALIAAAEAESVPAPEPTPAPVDTDPNKPMSPDEIAALIAATEAGSASEVEAKAEPVVEAKAAPVPAAPVVDDPNKQMSPEDIAALFASSNLELEPEPSTTKPKTAIEALSKHEPSPASDDPNKPMSPDDIAALIASLGQ